jgi:hypothetical protein
MSRNISIQTYMWYYTRKHTILYLIDISAIHGDISQLSLTQIDGVIHQPIATASICA